MNSVVPRFVAILYVRLSALGEVSIEKPRQRVGELLLPRRECRSHWLLRLITSWRTTMQHAALTRFLGLPPDGSGRADSQTPPPNATCLTRKERCGFCQATVQQFPSLGPKRHNNNWLWIFLLQLGWFWGFVIMEAGWNTAACQPGFLMHLKGLLCRYYIWHVQEHWHFHLPLCYKLS